MEFPPLWYSAQQASATSGFLNSSVFWFPSSKPYSVLLFQKHLQVENLVGIRGFLFFGSFFLRDHYPSLPIIKCLKKFVSDILSVFLVTFNGRTSPVPNTLTGGSRSSRDFHVCHLRQLSQALPGTQNWLL